MDSPAWIVRVEQEDATITAGLKRVLLLSLLAAAWPVVAAEPARVDPAVSAGADVPRPAGGDPRYGDRSDEELTALAADWDALDRHQRRALLTEMRLRMARGGARAGGQEGVLHIRTERRYGRLIRQSDGRVIRIETQVVHVRRVGPDDGAPRRGFGVGFEQRVAHRRASVIGGNESAVVRVRSAQDSEPLTDVLGSLGPALRPEPLAPVYPVADGTR